jgi:WD40 repeat protein
MAASDGRTLRVRKSPSGRPHETLEVRDGESGLAGECIAFSHDSRYLASSCRGESAVRVFDTSTWDEIATHPLDSGKITAIAFSRDGNELAVGTSTSKIELCTVPGGARRVLRKARSAESSEAQPILYLFYGASDRTLLANAGRDVIEIDRAQGDVLWSRSEERVLAVSRDARSIVSVSLAAGLPRILELTGGSEPKIACTIHDPAAPSEAESAAFAPDGTWLAVGFGRTFLGAHWQELEFYRLTPVKSDNTKSNAEAETLHAEPIRSLRAGQPRRITISPDGSLMCLCTVPIAGVYEMSYLLKADDLR